MVGRPRARGAFWGRWHGRHATKTCAAPRGASTDPNMVRDGAHLFKSVGPLCKLFNMVDSAAAGGAAAPPRAIPWGVSDLGGLTEYSNIQLYTLHLTYTFDMYICEMGMEW